MEFYILKHFPKYQDFNVIHNYLVSSMPHVQARIRKRGQDSNFEAAFIEVYSKNKVLFFYEDIWSYTYTIRSKEDGQAVETREQIDKREYSVGFDHINVFIKVSRSI